MKHPRSSSMRQRRRVLARCGHDAAAQWIRVNMAEVLKHCMPIKLP